jgi:hypothetical protein
VGLHELVHWLDYCSTAHVDYDHADLRLWGAVGVEERAAKLAAGGAIEVDAEPIADDHVYAEKAVR